MNIQLCPLTWSTRVPGFSGCIEHASTVWEAKKTRGNLDVMWVDLANAYGSLPHKLLMKAMDFVYTRTRCKVS